VVKSLIEARPAIEGRGRAEPLVCETPVLAGGR
jgi:hypothetical protein